MSDTHCHYLVYKLPLFGLLTSFDDIEGEAAGNFDDITFISFLFFEVKKRNYLTIKKYKYKIRLENRNYP